MRAVGDASPALESVSARISDELVLTARRVASVDRPVHWSVYRCIAPNAPALISSMTTEEACGELGSMVGLGDGCALVTWNGTVHGDVRGRLVEVSPDGAITFGNVYMIADIDAVGDAQYVSESEAIVLASGINTKQLVRVKRTSGLRLDISTSTWDAPPVLGNAPRWDVLGFAYYDHDKVMAFVTDASRLHAATYRHVPGRDLELLDISELGVHAEPLGASPIRVRDLLSRTAVGFVSSHDGLTAHTMVADGDGRLSVSAGVRVSAHTEALVASFEDGPAGIATDMFLAAWVERGHLSLRTVMADSSGVPSLGSVSRLSLPPAPMQHDGMRFSISTVNHHYVFVSNGLGVILPDVPLRSRGRYAGGPWEVIEETTFYTASVEFSGVQTLTPPMIAGGILQEPRLGLSQDVTVVAVALDGCEVYFPTAEVAEPQAITMTSFGGDTVYVAAVSTPAFARYGSSLPLDSNLMTVDEVTFKVNTTDGWAEGIGYVWNGTEHVAIVGRFLWTENQEWVAV